MGQKSVDEYYNKLNRHFAGCVKRYVDVILFHDKTRYLASDTFIMVDIPSDKINEVFSDRKLFPELPEVNIAYIYRSYSVGEVSIRRDINKDRILEVYNQADLKSRDIIAPTGWIRNFGDKANYLLFKEVKVNADETNLRTKLIDIAKLSLFTTKDTLDVYRTNLDEELAPVVIEKWNRTVGMLMPAWGNTKHEVSDLSLLNSSHSLLVGKLEHLKRLLEDQVLKDLINELTLIDSCQKIGQRWGAT